MGKHTNYDMPSDRKAVNLVDVEPTIERRQREGRDKQARVVAFLIILVSILGALMVIQ